MAPKSIPSALGISQASYYKLRRGQCTYNLFVSQIARSELARIDRARRGEPSASNPVVTPRQWNALNIRGLIRDYAPSLLAKGLLPRGKGRDSHTEDPSAAPYETKRSQPAESETLIEALVPILIQCSLKLQSAERRLRREGTPPVQFADDGLTRDPSVAALQKLIDELPYPAGFQTGGELPRLLGINTALLKLLGIRRSKLVGTTLRVLLELIIDRVISSQRDQVRENLFRRLAERRLAGQEREPFCIRFRMAARTRKGQPSRVVEVTTVVFDLGAFGSFHPVHSFFVYHVTPINTNARKPPAESS